MQPTWATQLTPRQPAAVPRAVTGALLAAWGLKGNKGFLVAFLST